MTATAENRWAMLHDLEMAARHLLLNQRSARARAYLRQACDRSAAFRQREAAEHKLAQTAPEDPRPESSPAEPPPTPEGPLGMPPGYRAPFKED